MKSYQYKYNILRVVFLLLCCCFTLMMQAQNAYSVKKGRMFIQLNKDIKEKELTSFINDYELQDIPLKDFIQKNNPDLLVKQGWKIELNNSSFIIISKKLEAAEDVGNIERIIINDKVNPLFPAGNNNVFGINKFRTHVFSVTNNVVSFTLKGFLNAKRVMLAGGFNDWKPDALSMEKTADGWIARVPLKEGKWHYKFIVDGNWMTDPDNLQRENDEGGNTNSVYYVTNTYFVCKGFTNAKRVFVSGSFNNWKKDELPMTKISSGWVLAAYLPQGTHTYRFVVDGQWYTDAGNNDKLPNEFGEFNSVIRIGTSHLFTLDGYNTAKQVILSGSFNGWRENELLLTKTAKGWELPYTLGPGNYEYKFRVDGKWIADPKNPMTSTVSGNSYLILEPNFTFKLNGFGNAKHVFLAGDFNNWDPRANEMKREGNNWIITTYLSPGKHLYKFVVDGEWIIDPANKQWEQNDQRSGNSVIWIRN